MLTEQQKNLVIHIARTIFTNSVDAHPQSKTYALNAYSERRESIVDEIAVNSLLLAEAFVKAQATYKSINH